MLFRSQCRSGRIRFVRGVSKEPDEVRAFATQHGLDLSTDLADALADPRVQAVAARYKDLPGFDGARWLYG